MENWQKKPALMRLRKFIKDLARSRGFNYDDLDREIVQATAYYMGKTPERIIKDFKWKTNGDLEKLVDTICLLSYFALAKLRCESHGKPFDMEAKVLSFTDRILRLSRKRKITLDEAIDIVSDTMEDFMEALEDSDIYRNPSLSFHRHRDILKDFIAEVADEEDQTQVHVESMMLNTWLKFCHLTPWKRAVFPFYVTVRPSAKTEPVKVYVEMLEETGSYGLECSYEFNQRQVVVTLRGYALDAYPEYMVIMDGMEVGRSWETGFVLTCAMLSVIDLLLVDVHVVECQEKSRRRLATVPTWRGDIEVDIDYNPKLYVPKPKIVRDIQDILNDLEEEMLARHSQHGEHPYREKVKHRVPCFKRDRPMSVRQKEKLLALMADGFVPIDRFGNEIPMPEHGEYTIVLEHERGNRIPEVVSGSALDFMVKEMREEKPS